MTASKSECFVDSDGEKCWWFNDKLHRTDGPAVEEPNGFKEWWLNGERVDFRKTKNPAVKELLKYKKIYDIMEG